MIALLFPAFDFQIPIKSRRGLDEDEPNVPSNVNDLERGDFGRTANICSVKDLSCEGRCSARHVRVLVGVV